MASTGEAGRFRVLSVSLFILGALLLVVAGAGPLAWDFAHHRGRAGLPGYDYATTAPLSGWDDPRLTRRPGEATLPYVTRANRAVAAAVYHCAADDPQTWATSLLAATSDTALWSDEGVIDPASLRCGLCSQVTFVLAETLRRNGVESADGRGLDGHVVVTFRHAGREYVVGPDFGIDPFVIEWNNPEQVARVVSTVYRDFLPTPPDWQRSILDVFVDTSTDGIQYAPALRRLAAEQARQVAAVEALRWVAVMVGALLLAVGALTSRRAASSSGLRRSQQGRPTSLSRRELTHCES